MKKSQLHHSSILLALITLVLCGCSTGSTATDTSGREPMAIAPPIGSFYAVHFRRNYLGVARENPIPIDAGTFNGADITLRGALVKMDNQWLLIKTIEGKETWIPRNAILHMTVTSR